MASCSSCTSGASAYQYAQKSVQQQFQSKDIAQYVKEAAEPQQSNALNTSGDRGRALNVTA